MSLILVVEKDADFKNQLGAALSARGHEIDAVASCEAGEQSAASRRPILVLASGMLAGAPQLLSKFAKRNGGPGAAVIVPAQMAGEISAHQFGADVLLPKPMSPTDLAAVLDLLPPAAATLAPSAAPPTPAPPTADPAILPNVGAQLTSEEIFGDVLAEVEADVERRLSSKPSTIPPSTPSSPAPRPAAPSPPAIPQVAARQLTTPQPAAPPAAPQATTPPAAPTTSGAHRPIAPPRRRRTSDDEIDRKLEETLSGFFPDKLRPSAKEKTKPAKPRRAATPSADEIDDLLDKTLSSLELPRSRKPRREVTSQATSAPSPADQASTPASRPQHPAAAPPTPAAAAPAPPPIAPGPPAALPSAAQTMRPETPQPAVPAPPPPHPETATEPPAPPEKQAAASTPWMPDQAQEDEILRTGTFDLPALEPLPDQPPPIFEAEVPLSPIPPLAVPLPPPAALEPPNHGSAPAIAQDFSPTVELPPAIAFKEPTFEAEALQDFSDPSSLESLAPPPPAVDLPELPPADGWSVSGYGEIPTPDSALPPIAHQAPLETSYPASFDLPAVDNAFDPPSNSAFVATPTPSPAVDDAYPSDFESAFALPNDGNVDVGGGQMGFSPDPTETVEPEDTASLQKTLEGVLQIRNGAASSSSKTGIPFGDYRLLERVAVGGMAEVWRAQRRGVEGFQKIVAIKKILSHLTGSQDFITMFIDEAKLAAQLNHANIIQIYDLGKVEDDFFIAMEFVDGKDLRSIQNQAKAKNQTLPLGLCLMVTAALARALDYAHRKRDFDNRDLGLVHRDVSPQNVLISYEGEIKLCDFGIVKAVAKASSTQMGALKGKLQYMSPEQAWGKEVDARSDIFSLGSVFFELLTGQRLFTGDSEIGVLDAVRDCRVQSPRNIDPQVPVEVEAIVMRALAATPETRYQTAGEMEKDINTVLEQLRLSVGQTDMAQLMAHLFGPHESTQAPAEPSFTPSDPSSFAPPEELQSSTPAIPDVSEPPPSAAPAPKAAPEKTGFSRAWLIAAIALLALAAVVVVLMMKLDDDVESPAAPQLPTTTSPAPSAQSSPAQTPAASQTGPAETEAAGDDTGAAPAPDESGSTSPDTPTPEASEGGAESGGGPAAQGTDFEQMVKDAVDSNREKMEQDFETRRREIEAELKRVRESGGESEQGGGNS